MSHLVFMQRDDLIDVLNANLRGHMQDFDSAMVGYRRTIAAEALRVHDAAVSGETVDLSRILMLPIPREYTEDYFDAMEALSAAINVAADKYDPAKLAMVGMTAETYAEVVDDNWPWAEEFDAVYELYANTTPCVSCADINPHDEEFHL